ncbi:hypothetical protein KUV28_17110 [Ferrimonas balearica]|nr:hypothetical protein [Ferrimonas balearica]
MAFTLRRFSPPRSLFGRAVAPVLLSTCIAGAAAASCDGYWDEGDRQYDRADALYLRVERGIESLRGASVDAAACNAIRSYQGMIGEARGAFRDSAESYRKAIFACADAYNSTRDGYYLQLSEDARYNRDVSMESVDYSGDLRDWLSREVRRCD